MASYTLYQMELPMVGKHKEFLVVELDEDYTYEFDTRKERDAWVRANCSCHNGVLCMRDTGTRVIFANRMSE